ncbi:MAG TPA: hypothetical protein VEX65_00230, partial [Flavisolibacter sp.]|nr:hypothetical protein [Flavisolibacter sp.]
MILPFVTVVFNWRKDVNQTGLYSVYPRITINRASRYYKIQTPEKIAPSQWSGTEDAWVKP